MPTCPTFSDTKFVYLVKVVTIISLHYAGTFPLQYQQANFEGILQQYVNLLFPMNFDLVIFIAVNDPGFLNQLFHS